MADPKKLADAANGEPPSHPLISKQGLAAGADPAGLTELVGYIGPSGKAGFSRLYLDLSFQQYVEFPNGVDQVIDIVNAGPDDPDGPSRVYLKASTPVTVVVSPSISTVAGAVPADSLTGQSRAACPRR